MLYQANNLTKTVERERERDNIHQEKEKKKMLRKIPGKQIQKFIGKKIHPNQVRFVTRKQEKFNFQNESV